MNGGDLNGKSTIFWRNLPGDHGDLPVSHVRLPQGSRSALKKKNESTGRESHPLFCFRFSLAGSEDTLIRERHPLFWKVVCWGPYTWKIDLIWFHYTYHDWSTNPPNVPPPRNKALWSGLINHWFPLIRPAIKTLISGGYVARGGLVDQPLTYHNHIVVHIQKPADKMVWLWRLPSSMTPRTWLIATGDIMVYIEILQKSNMFGNSVLALQKPISPKK